MDLEEELFGSESDDDSISSYLPARNLHSGSIVASNAPGVPPLPSTVPISNSDLQSRPVVTAVLNQLSFNQLSFNQLSFLIFFL
jgi:hypothetical protein